MKTGNISKIFKRLSIVSCLVIVSVFFYTSKRLKNVQIVPTMAMPVTNKVIILDAGHGKPDEGAQSVNGITEASINLKIALKTQKLLENSGATVILTRSDDNAIYEIDAKTLSDQKVSDIKNRVKIGNSSSADIFISIHLNKFEQSQYNGWQTFYRTEDEKSQLLATQIQNNLNSTIDKENNRVPHTLNNIYIMKNVEIPITVVECGFLSNPQEESELQTDDYQTKLSWGIYNGIMDYFNS